MFRDWTKNQPKGQYRKEVSKVFQGFPTWKTTANAVPEISSQLGKFLKNPDISRMPFKETGYFYSYDVVLRQKATVHKKKSYLKHHSRSASPSHQGLLWWLQCICFFFLDFETTLASGVFLRIWWGIQFDLGLAMMVGKKFTKRWFTLKHHHIILANSQYISAYQIWAKHWGFWNCSAGYMCYDISSQHVDRYCRGRMSGQKWHENEPSHELGRAFWCWILEVNLLFANRINPAWKMFSGGHQPKQWTLSLREIPQIYHRLASSLMPSNMDNLMTPASSHRIHGTGIFTYIWLIFMGNVGKYTIHGSYLPQMVVKCIHCLDPVGTKEINYINVGVYALHCLDPMGIFVVASHFFSSEGRLDVGLWIELRWIRMPIIRVLEEICNNNSEIKSIPIPVQQGNLVINESSPLW